MFEKVKIFFGFASDQRVAEGWLSWQHILFVTIAIGIATALGIYFGRKNRTKTTEEKVKVLKVAALLIVGFELFKIGIICWRNHNIMEIRSNLPLFLCSIMLFALPIAAFSKGRLQEAALDFSFSFGFLCAIAGTYLAGNIFSGPILKFDPIVSVTTHCISGFSAVYIGVSGLVRMKKENLWISAMILIVFELLALGVDILQVKSDYMDNYMFFMRPDGTPFSILMGLAKNVQWVYTLLVGLIYFVYLAAFDAVFCIFFASAKQKQKSHI